MVSTTLKSIRDTIVSSRAFARVRTDYHDKPLAVVGHGLLFVSPLAEPAPTIS